MPRLGPAPTPGTNYAGMKALDGDLNILDSLPRDIVSDQVDGWLWEAQEEVPPLRAPQAYAVGDPVLLAHTEEGALGAGSRLPPKLRAAYCRQSADVTMRGGTTSGVIYPLAICEIARRYRLRNIGGALAGAIAAGAAAAAELGRATAEATTEAATASSRRQLRLPVGTEDALRQHRARQLAQQDLMGEYWQDLRLVFPTSRGTLLDPANLRRSLRTVTEKAGLGRWHPHELRHSAASLLSAAGVPLEEIADLLGHASTRVTSATYRHRTTPTVEAGAGPMNEILSAGQTRPRRAASDPCAP